MEVRRSRLYFLSLVFCAWVGHLVSLYLTVFIKARDSFGLWEFLKSEMVSCSFPCIVDLKPDGDMVFVVLFFLFETGLLASGCPCLCLLGAGITGTGVCHHAWLSPQLCGLCLMLAHLCRCTPCVQAWGPQLLSTLFFEKGSFTGSGAYWSTDLKPLGYSCLYFLMLILQILGGFSHGC